MVEELRPRLRDLRTTANANPNVNVNSNGNAAGPLTAKRGEIEERRLQRRAYIETSALRAVEREGTGTTTDNGIGSGSGSGSAIGSGSEMNGARRREKGEVEMLERLVGGLAQS